MAGVTQAQQFPFSLSQEFVNDLAKFGPILNVCADASVLGYRIERQLAKIAGDADFNVVCYFLLTRSITTHESIQILCRCGFASDAISLAASLFENKVNLLYINRGRKVRSLRFMLGESAEKYVQATKVLRRKRLHGERWAYKRRVAAVEEEYLQAAQIALPGGGNRLTRGWSGLNLKDRAKTVGAGLAYDQLYWVLCAHKHNLPVGAFATIDPDARHSPVLIEPSIKNVFAAAVTGTSLFIGILLAVNQFFDFSDEAAIRNLDRNLAERQAECESKYPDECS